MRAAIVAAAVLALGCSPPPSGQATPTKAEPAAAARDGRYIVVAIDGAPPVINIAGYRPTVSIAGARVHFQSQCIYRDWTLHEAGGAVSTKPYFEPGSGMCARGLAPGERAIEAAFTGLTQVTPSADGGLQVAGGGHVLHLRRAVAADEGPPPPVTTLAGEWRVAGIDGAGLDEPVGLALTGTAQELWWEPRCAGLVRSYRIIGTAITFGPALGAPQPGGPPRPVCTIAPPPRMAEVLRALGAARSITRTPHNGVLLSGGGHSLLLFAQ